LLVEPWGITDGEVAILEQAVSAGAVLIVAGEVENAKLLDLLGIARMEGSVPSKSWRISAEMESLGIGADTLPSTEGRSECDLHGYQTVKANSAADVLSGDGKISGTAVAIHAHGKGKCVFVRRAYETMPSFLVEQTAEEKRGTPRVHGQQDPAMKSTRELMESLAKVHPDALDLVAAGLIQAADRSLPRCDKGQLLGFKAADGCDYLLVENSASLVYATVHVALPKAKASVDEFPHKPIGPVGYIFYGDPNDQSFDVCVPPDAGIAVKISYAEDK
jgi:hypothetical protein